MTALTFSLKKPLRFPVNCAQLTPHVLDGKSHDEIASLALSYGNQYVPLSELFDISGNDATQIHFKNVMPMLEYLGAEMQGGSLTIEGDAGANLGFGMRQGTIHCMGNSGNYAACNMSGGVLKIEGNTGHFLGAASAGLRKGMRGGTVIVQGNAGDRVGDQMRRGLILIAGNAGDYCGSRMIAGTIGVWGSIGHHLGYSMQRGTLLVVKPFTVSPTIQDCGAHTLPFLNLLFKSFQSLDTPFKHITSQRVQRYVGDLACNGNGEILHLLPSHLSN
jgi:formylmethanofuran dehydrogenase subunit C